MAYVRKTTDLYEVCADYGCGHGFEVVCYEETLKDAKRTLRDYVENDTYALSHTIRKRRVPIEG